MAKSVITKRQTLWIVGRRYTQMTTDNVKPLIKNHQGKLRPTKKELRLHSLKFDKRRKTVYEHNVNQLTKLERK